MTSIPSSRARRVVESCLQFDPVRRCTAADLCEAELFASIRESSRHLDMNRRVSKRSMKLRWRCCSLQMDVLQELCRLNVEESISANVKIFIRIEEFPRDDAQRSTANNYQPVLTIRDNDVLADNIIFMLNVKHRYRLCITMRHLHINKVPFRKVEWVRVKAPDANELELRVEESQTTEYQLESTALFDTTALNSNKMNTVPKSYANPDERYLPLDIVIGVRPRVEMSADENSIMQLKGRIYCKMHSENDNLSFMRLAQSVEDKWNSAPRWMRFTIKGTARLGDAVVGSLISI